MWNQLLRFINCDLAMGQTLRPPTFVVVWPLKHHFFGGIGWILSWICWRWLFIFQYYLHHCRNLRLVLLFFFGSRLDISGAYLVWTSKNRRKTMPTGQVAAVAVLLQKPRSSWNELKKMLGDKDLWGKWRRRARYKVRSQCTYIYIIYIQYINIYINKNTIYIDIYTYIYIHTRTNK